MKFELAVVLIIFLAIVIFVLAGLVYVSNAVFGNKTVVNVAKTGIGATLAYDGLRGLFGRGETPVDPDSIIVQGGNFIVMDQSVPEINDAADLPIEGGGKATTSAYIYPTIHISGPSGAGKTTLGEKIKQLYPNAHVFDVDEITGPIVDDLLQARHSEKYMISHYIKNVEQAVSKILNEESRKQPVIMVGFMDWGNIYKVHTPNIKFDHKFFINVPDKTLINQRWSRDVQTRFCGRICKPFPTTPIRVDVLFEPKSIIMHKKTMTKQYKHLGYTFGSADMILSKIQGILPLSGKIAPLSGKIAPLSGKIAP